MELRQLRHFIAVAEELHFGRAAARLGIKQPPLSQSIQRLEQSLGVALFVRSPQRVALTAAGRTLLPEAREIVTRVESAALRTRLAEDGERARINIGFLPWSMVRSIPAALRKFARQWPGVKTELFERTSRQQIASLHAGTLDLGIVSLRHVTPEGLAIRVIEHSRLAVAVPSGWPLARQPSLRLADLAGHPFIMFSPQLSPEGYRRTLAACHEAGFAPNIVQEAGHAFTMLSMVASEMGIATIQSTAASMPVQGVAIVPLADAPESMNLEIALAWDAKNMTAALGGLIDHLGAAAGGERLRTSEPGVPHTRDVSADTGGIS